MPPRCFAARATSRDPAISLTAEDEQRIDEICRRLDRLPLAIELAAARSGLLGIAELAERLDTALGEGPRDAPARQRTLRATIEWSHALLADAEQTAFARLAVFAGGATLEAAQTITGASLETLERLVAKSLLVRQRRPQAPTRVQMLETVRSYALERLAEDRECEVVNERHCRYFLQLAGAHEPHLFGRDRGPHLARLDAEAPNLDVAVNWALARQETGLALDVLDSVDGYWFVRHRFGALMPAVERALATPAADTDCRLRGRTLLMKYHLLWPLGRWAEGPAVTAEAVALFRRLDDRWQLGAGLCLLGSAEGFRGNLKAANVCADEALELAAALDHDRTLAQAMQIKALFAPTPAQRRVWTQRAAATMRRYDSLLDQVYLFTLVAYQELADGYDHEAEPLLEQARPHALALDYPHALMLFHGACALAALFTGRTADASAEFRRQLQLCAAHVHYGMINEGLLGMAAISAAGGDLERAAYLAGAADAHRYGEPENGVKARLRTTLLDPARLSCRDDAWNAAFRQGAGLSFDAAIADALTTSETRQHASPRLRSNQPV